MGNTINECLLNATSLSPLPNFSTIINPKTIIKTNIFKQIKISNNPNHLQDIKPETSEYRLGAKLFPPTIIQNSSFEQF